MSPATVLVRAAMRLVSSSIARRAGLAAAPPSGALPEAVQGAHGILVVALAEAGDMVLLSPFLRALRAGAPTAHVSLVCRPATAVLYECSPHVDAIVPYDCDAPRLLRPVLLPTRARAFARTLSAPNDVCIVPRWDTDHHFAAAVACFSGAPRRVGHTERSNARKAVLNAGFDRLYTDVVTSLGIAHEVERHLALLDALGVPRGSTRLELSIADADRRRAHDALGFEPDERPLVAFGIGAAHAKRRWPIARFAELGRELQRRSGVRLVIVGGAGDVADQQALVAALGEGVVPLAGRLTLRETAAVLERSRLYVGNDSAPMHLAVGMDTPCVEISCHPASGDPLHANAPERFGPWLVPSRVIRPRAPIPPCTDGCRAHEPHCILGVDAERVLDAAGELLEIAAGRVRREPRTP